MILRWRCLRGNKGTKDAHGLCPAVDNQLTEWGESAFGGQNRKKKDIGIREKLNHKKILFVVYRFTIVLLFILPILPAVSTLLAVSSNTRRILPILLTHCRLQYRAHALYFEALSMSLSPFGPFYPFPSFLFLLLLLFYDPCKTYFFNFGFNSNVEPLVFIY